MLAAAFRRQLVNPVPRQASRDTPPSPSRAGIDCTKVRVSIVLLQDALNAKHGDCKDFKNWAEHLKTTMPYPTPPAQRSAAYKLSIK